MLSRVPVWLRERMMLYITGHVIPLTPDTLAQLQTEVDKRIREWIGGS